MIRRMVVRGEQACFARPDSPDPVSYPIPPASACRGLAECVFWHPGLYVNVRSISVLSPIRWTRDGITEVRASKQTKDPSGVALPRLDERAGTLTLPIGLVRVTTRVCLRDPAWLIELELRQLPGATGGKASLQKAVDMFDHRLATGRLDRPPFLGISEYRGLIMPATGNEKPIAWSRDFGFVLHDMDYAKDPPIAHFYHAVMKAGVVQVPSFFDSVIAGRRAA